MVFKLTKSERVLLHDVACRIERSDFPNWLRCFGVKFERICERTPVYRCKEWDMVVKRPNFILNPQTPLKVRVPTIKLENGWVVQPYALKHDRKLAKELIIKMLGTDIGYDVHGGNLGWYDGKPVLFDW